MYWSQLSRDTHGVPGQWWLISGNHFWAILIKEWELITENITTKTSVPGYDKGLEVG